MCRKFIHTYTIISQKYPKGDEHKQLLKEGVGEFSSVVTFLLPTSHIVSLTLVIYTGSDSAMPFLSYTNMLVYATTANGVWLHLLVLLHSTASSVLMAMYKSGIGIWVNFGMYTALPNSPMVFACWANLTEQ